MTRYIRALATLVTPDPNAMLRVARLRDAKWQMPGDGPEGKPRRMSLGDAMQVASALWVKEAIGVPDLEFLTFDDWCSDGSERGDRLCLLHLQDYAVDAGVGADVKTPTPIRRARSNRSPTRSHTPIPYRRDERPPAVGRRRRQFLRSRANSASMTGARMVLTAKTEPLRL